MAQAISDTYEYVVQKKNEGGYKTKRILMILGYFVIAIAEFVICYLISIPQLFALAPVSLWIIYYFTWPNFSIEHEYILIDGNIVFSKIYGGRRRKEIFSMRISAFEKIAPFTSANDSELVAFNPSVEYSAFSSDKNPIDAYYATFTKDNGTRCIFFFEATNRAIRILKYYNPSTVMTTLSK